MPTILITGATGYIGSHILVQLISQKFNVLCIDSGVNSYKNIMYKNVAKITNRTRISRYSLNLAEDFAKLDDVFNNHLIDYVIHLAALKSVTLSLKDPLTYYNNNLQSTINLLKCCKKYKIKGFIFSSSATVYSPNQNMPLTEESNIGHNLSNPYAKTKYFCEEIIKDFSKTSNMPIVILRYFNPIGHHSNGLLIERPKGLSQNLMPNVIDVLKGNREKLTIYGNDYETKDGTCIRDFIHVEDVASSHLVVLQSIVLKKLPKKFEIYNVGLGSGTSVMEIVKKLDIKYEIKNKRTGDLPVVYCSNEKIKKDLNWEPKYTIENCLNQYKLIHPPISE